MNICFEWIFWIFIKWIIFWTNILVLLYPRQLVVAKCLKLIWNQSGIIRRTYFSPFQGVYYLYRGLRRAPKPYFCLILEFWIIFLIFYEWIILLNILDSIEWIFFWMNIADSAQTEYCTTFHCPSVCVSQAWHLNFSQLFDDLGHVNHVFSESI